MFRLLILSLGCFVAVLGCSSREAKNPYKETHIVDVMPEYKIQVDEPPTSINSDVENMSESALKARFSQLQNQGLPLTPRQKKEFDLIEQRLRSLSAN